MNLTEFLSSLAIKRKGFLLGAICCCLFSSIILHAQVEIDPVTGFPIQEEETGPIIGADTTEVRKTKYSFKKTFSEYYPHPRTALYLGFAFPAGGQLYNKDFWKVPFIWGAYGAVFYLAQTNNTQYKLLRDAVIDRLNGREDPFIQTIPSIQGLRAQRDAVRKLTEQSFIALIFTHLLSSMEAFVSAHLKGFNVSEDVSYSIRPQMLGIVYAPESNTMRGTWQPQMGIGLQINF